MNTRSAQKWPMNAGECGVGRLIQRIETCYKIFDDIEQDIYLVRRNSMRSDCVSEWVAILYDAINAFRYQAGKLVNEMACESIPQAGHSFGLIAKLKKDAVNNGVQTANMVDARKILREGYAGHRVLVVDDEPINQEIAQALLEEVGLSVDTAETGAKAIAMAQANAYSVILMDLQMPEIDGLLATCQIRENPVCQKTPIIAFTANAFPEDMARCFDSGMNDFLTKPVEPDRLYAVLLKWMGELSMSGEKTVLGPTILRVEG